MPNQLFICWKRERYVSKTGKPAIFYFLAIQMIQISTNGTPRNKVFREYYLKRVAEGKNIQQALICIARRLVNIVYGMLKNHTEYRERCV